MKMYYNDVLAEVYIERNQRDLAIEVLREAGRLDVDGQSCENIGNNLLRKLKRSEQLAEQYLRKGFVNQAEKTLSESLRIAHDIYGYENQHKDVAQIYLKLAHTSIQQKNFLKAKEYLVQTNKMMSCSNIQHDIVFLFHMRSSDLLMAQEDYKGALQCLYELIKIVGELSDYTLSPVDLAMVHLQEGKCYLVLGKLPAAEHSLLLSKNYLDKAVVQDGEKRKTRDARYECTFYLAKCCITSSGQVDKALTLLQETLKGVYSILKNSIPTPHYLDDLDSSLIRILRAQDKLSDTSTAIAHTCCMHMGKIYAHMGKEKLARRYFKMSDLHVDV